MVGARADDPEGDPPDGDPDDELALPARRAPADGRHPDAAQNRDQQRQPVEVNRERPDVDDAAGRRRDVSERKGHRRRFCRWPRPVVPRGGCAEAVSGEQPCSSKPERAVQVDVDVHGKLGAALSSKPARSSVSARQRATRSVSVSSISRSVVGIEALRLTWSSCSPLRSKRDDGFARFRSSAGFTEILTPCPLAVARGSGERRLAEQGTHLGVEVGAGWTRNCGPSRRSCEPCEVTQSTNTWLSPG